jgi:mycofactocin precursor
MADEPTATQTEILEPDEEQVAEDVLVEEVSIDGMCGVY